MWLSRWPGAPVPLRCTAFERGGMTTRHRYGAGQSGMSARHHRPVCGELTNGARLIKAGLDPVRVPFDQIPVIDLEAMFTGDAEAKAALAESLRKACTEVGFLYIKNHHFPKAVWR